MTDGVRNAEAPDMALDDQGQTVATWRGYDSGTGTFRTQAGRMPSLGPLWFGPSTLANTEIGGSGTPHVAIDPDGNATIIWHNLDSTVVAVSRPADGGFEPGVRPSPTTASEFPG